MPPHKDPGFYIASHITRDLRQGLARAGDIPPNKEPLYYDTPKLLYHQTPVPLLCDSTLLEKWVHVRSFVFLNLCTLLVHVLWRLTLCAQTHLQGVK